MSSSRSIHERVEKLESINRYLQMHTVHWCPIVSSKQIKVAIVDRINELGVSAYEVAIRADVSYPTFKKYYLDEDDPKSRASMRPEDLMRIGKLIGIKIKTILVMTPAENIDRKKLLNDKFIPKEKRKKNRKDD